MKVTEKRKLLKILKVTGDLEYLMSNPPSKTLKSVKETVATGTK